MLILSRRVGEAIIIDQEIIIRVLEVKGKQVRLGFEAPAQHRIHRSELYQQMEHKEFKKK